MKTKHIFRLLTILSLSLFTLTSRATDITATNSGNWSDISIWDSGTVPGATDDVDVPFGVTVTVDTNVTVQYIYDSGTVIMAPSSTLDLVFDQAIASSLIFDTSAISNTVTYSGNAYFARPQDYYNLVFDGLGGFYNGDLGNGPIPMTIAGNLTVSGTASVQAGADITIDGDLTVGTTNANAYFDCSVARIIVGGNTVVNTLLMDGDGALTNAFGEIETNLFLGDVTINPGATLNVSDVPTWAVGGSFTNNGKIKGKSYGSIAFDGAGIIAGTNTIILPAASFNGTYTIGNTVMLTNNTPILNGTLIFDLARTNQIVLKYSGPLTSTNTTATNYYGGNLVVINSGATPASGNSYQLFSAQTYAGGFASTSFPSLPAGFSWVDSTLTNGSISVVGGSIGSPMLAFSRNGNVVTLSWDSATYPGYSVQGQTNSAGIHSNWSATGSGTTSPYVVTVNPTNPPVFFRLSNP